MATIPDTIIEECHSNLIKNAPVLNNLMKIRGLKKEIIIKYKIGWDGSRYTIPIKSLTDKYVNIRKWNNKLDPKILSYGEGFGENRLFPISELKNNNKKKIIICEGEWDCLILRQYGFFSFTSTCGCASWKDEWNNYFIGKDIYLMFDCDDPGQKFSKKLGVTLSAYANAVKVVDLALSDGEDISDWFVKYKKTKEELVKLLKDTEEMDLYQLVNLGEGLRPSYYDKKIKFNGIVVGKDLSPYLVPKKVIAKCIGCDSKKSELCPLSGGIEITLKYNYEEHKESIIKFINASDSQIKGIIKRDLGVPSGDQCRRVSMKISERQSIEDISLIPEVSFEHERIDEKEYVNRRAFFFGDGVQTNQSYIFRGTTWSDPKNQMGIHLVVDMKGSRDSISKFIIDEEVRDRLKIFQPKDQNDPASIWEKLDDIYKDFTYNVTHIYGRQNIIMATDLVYHSAIDFYFLGRYIVKGWLECAIIGDTRTGKTETVKTLVKHYRSGEFLTSGENTSRSGLLGGAQQHNGRWTLTWGKIPLNDRRLLVIDEADELAERGLMGQLSGVRSSGIAEVVMIQTQKTLARTRIIWIANPIKGRVTEHNYGINTIEKIFGKHQDISRIDFALIVAKEEVDKSIINQVHKERYAHKYISDLCHSCVMWIWNRKASDIVWADNAEQLVLDTANEIGEKYSSDIPLIIDAEARIKLARMAVALAGRLFSTDEAGQKIIVYPAHVKVVSEFLQRLYDDKYMGYKDFSEQKNRNKVLEEYNFLDDTFTNIKQVNMFLEMTSIQISDIEDVFLIEKDQARKTLREMRHSNAVYKKSWYYKKSPAFIHYLKNKKEQLEIPF